MSEPFDPAQWRPAPLLPEKEARDAGLIFVIAVLCFLACLTALVVIAGDRAAQGWSGQLTGEATVIVRTKAGETPDAAAARAAEALAGVPGVTEARALEREKAYDLVRPWLGDISDLEDLPVPRLVAVTLDPKHPPKADDLDKVLKAQGLDALVDDHSVWIKDIQRAAGTVRWIGVAIFLLIAIAAGDVIAFATRAGLAARRDVVEVLHLSGAEDGYIARLFQIRFAQIAGIAGFIGAVSAGVLGAALRLAGGGQGLTPALPIAWLDLLAVLPCPLLAAGVAAVVAQRTALRLIRTLAVKSVAAFLVVALIWVSGLLAFAARVRQSTPPEPPQRADGVVALTGANSTVRIAAAVGLLEDGLANRVLVSGVNRDATREDIRKLSKAATRLYDCCVDLGFTAADTVGNARETADWAKNMRYRSLIIVTSDYHMPRAMLELRAVLREPQVSLQSYPVATPALTSRRWWRTPSAVRLITVEYCKYLAILGREAVLGLGPRDPPAAQPQKD